MEVKPVRLAGLALLLIVAVPGGAVGLERAEKTLSLDEALAEGHSLRVENLLGSITIRGGATDGRVRIDARVLAEAKTAAQAWELVESVRLDTHTDEHGYSVHLGFPVDSHTAYRHPKGGVSRWVAPILNRDSVSVEYDGEIVEVGSKRSSAALAVHLSVTLPMDLEATFRQVVGSIESSSSRGEMFLEIVGGDIVADHLYGRLHARAGAGTIEVSRFTGEELVLRTASGKQILAEVTADRARLTSGSGRISGTALAADSLEVTSNSGDVELTRFEPVHLAVRTDSGRIDLSPTFKKTRRIDLESSSGDVILEVSPTAAFDLLADTQPGKLETRGVDLHRLEPFQGTARYRRGPGGFEIKVAADTGQLTIKSRQ